MPTPALTSRPARAPRRSRAALAALALFAAAPASALIVVNGDVTPAIPASGIVTGGVGVGGTALGSLVVNGGSSLSSDALYLSGNSISGNGSVSVTGAGSMVAVSATAAGKLDVGGRGVGSLSVSDGGAMSYGLPSAERRAPTAGSTAVSSSATPPVRAAASALPARGRASARQGASSSATHRFSPWPPMASITACPVQLPARVRFSAAAASFKAAR